jgi:hypothetical protein
MRGRAERRDAVEEFVEREYNQRDSLERDPVTPTANTVYLRVKNTEVKSLLGSKYAVPQGFVGLVKDRKGGSKVMLPGEETSGEFTAHLVRDRDVRLPFTAQKAGTKDGFEAEADFELSVVPDVTRKDSLEAFIERTADGKRHVDWTLLKAELHKRIAEALRVALKEVDAEKLSDEQTLDQVRAKVIDHCRAELAAHGISEAGIEIARIRSKDFDTHRKEASEDERKVERSRAEQNVQAAILRDQLGQELSRKELEEFLASARHEGLIKEHERKIADIERKSELDRLEAEYREHKQSLEQALRKVVTEHHLELDGIMLDRHVAVVKKLRDELSEDRLEVYINMIQDEKIKADLLDRLIQRSMTPEQLSAIAEIEAQRTKQAEVRVSQPRLDPIREEQTPEQVAAEGEESSDVTLSDGTQEHRREVEVDDDDIAREAAERMNEALGTALSEAVTKAAIESTDVTEELEDDVEIEHTPKQEQKSEAETDKGAEVEALALVASGRRVFAIDPLTQRNLDLTHMSLDYSAGRLGSLRSVRICGEGDDRLVLAGARNGVYTTLVRHQKAHREFPIGDNVDATTGINAAVVYRGYIYATHSEFGLLRWPMLQPYSNAVRVMPDLTSKYTTTRNLQVFDDRLLFANGPVVLLLEADGESRSTLRVAARYRGTRHEVTALAADDSYVLVADTAGDVYVWDPKKDDTPVLAFYAGRSISDLSASELPGNRRSLLVAMKRPIVPMLFRDGAKALEFTAPEPVRSCAAYGGIIVGLSRDRMRLFAWHENRPDWPAWQFQFVEPVLDARLVAPGLLSRDGKVPTRLPEPGPKAPPGYGFY